MSPCENYQELISRMVDGDLSAREEADLARHIETCPDCAALYQAFSTLSDRIGEDLAESPFDLRDNVMAEIHRAEIRRRNRLPTILRSVLSAAACVALIVGVYLGVSLTQGKNLVTAAYDTGTVQEQKAEVPAEEARSLPLEEEAAAAEEPAPAPDAAKSEEEPAPEANAVAAMEAAPALTVDAAAGTAQADLTAAEPAAEEPAAEDAAPEETPEETDTEEAEEAALEEWELSDWDITLLRQLLKGSPDERSPEDLADYAFGRILLRNLREEHSILLYELDGELYYLDPVEETVYRSALTAEELRAFLAA